MGELLPVESQRTPRGEGVEGGSRKDIVRARWGLASREMRWPRRLESWVTDMKGIKGLRRLAFVVSRKILYGEVGVGRVWERGGWFPSSGTLPFYR